MARHLSQRTTGADLPKLIVLRAHSHYATSVAVYDNKWTFPDDRERARGGRGGICGRRTTANTSFFGAFPEDTSSVLYRRDDAANFYANFYVTGKEELS